MRPLAPFIDSEYISARQSRRRAERKARKSGSVIDKDIQNKIEHQTKKLFLKKKSSYYVSKFEEASGPKEVYSLVDNLMNKPKSGLPDKDEKLYANEFAEYFNDKILKIRHGFDTTKSNLEMDDRNDISDLEDSCSSSTLAFDSFCNFKPVSEDEIKKIIINAKPTTSFVDPCSTKFMLNFLDILLPIFVIIINMSLMTGTVPTAFKQASVRPLLKKPSLDVDDLCNYRPVSNLPFLSKVL